MATISDVNQAEMLPRPYVSQYPPPLGVGNGNSETSNLVMINLGKNGMLGPVLELGPDRI
jgi:hypothetical protein